MQRVDGTHEGQVGLDGGARQQVVHRRPAQAQQIGAPMIKAWSRLIIGLHSTNPPW
jgi:hypothetical protein